MYQDSDIMSVFNFLKDTPEGPLRKMMVGGEMTDGHFRLLMKMVKSGGDSQFMECFQSEGMPKIRMTPQELAMKETIWPIAKRKWVELGLLSSQDSKAA